jgi:hypothetical protein
LHEPDPGCRMERLSRYWMIALLVLASVTVAGCEAVAGIFKAGVWTGVVMVVILIAVIGFVATKIRG